MASRINGCRKLIVKKAIKDYVDNFDGEPVPGTPAYDDLMQNVENQVQTVLEEEGVIGR